MNAPSSSAATRPLRAGTADSAVEGRSLGDVAADSAVRGRSLGGVTADPVTRIRSLGHAVADSAARDRRLGDVTADPVTRIQSLGHAVADSAARGRSGASESPGSAALRPGHSVPAAGQVVSQSRREKVIPCRAKRRQTFLSFVRHYELSSQNRRRNSFYDLFRKSSTPHTPTPPNLTPSSRHKVESSHPKSRRSFFPFVRHLRPITPLLHHSIPPLLEPLLSPHHEPMGRQ